MLDLDHVVKIATNAARKAGDIQREKFGSVLTVDKRMRNDLKLETDRLCEASLVNDVRKAFPNHAILAEEGGATSGEEYIWYIDPLDGTVNFYYGIPYFCTTLACYRRTGPDDDGIKSMGEPLVGVTYAPLQDELFVGVVGQKATMNGQRITVREEPNLEEVALLTAISLYPEKYDFTMNRLLPLAARITKVRSVGACAYDLASVAMGRGSAFCEYGVHAWDHAAGRAIIEAAGGSYSAWPTPDKKWLVAASGKTVHADLVAAVRG